MNKKLKTHEKTDNIIIGYHGNVLHYKEDFFPNGSQALKRLANKYNFSLRVLTNNIGNQKLIQIISTNILWDNIISIERMKGNFTVYDITVPKYHNFIANGVVVHNSQLLKRIQKSKIGLLLRFIQIRSFYS